MRLTLGLAAFVTAIVLAACGSSSSSGKAPVACLGGPTTYTKALATAPDAVRLPGNLPINECLTDNQSAAEIGTVGATLVATATHLNNQARQAKPGAAGIQLGYLLGSAAKGAAGTSGIHADLVRRLDAAARFNDGKPLPPTFRNALAKGYAAGRANG